MLRERVRQVCWIGAPRVRGRICDDKILTAWNGLMISAFAKGAQILDEPRYADAARGAASFIRAAVCMTSRAAILLRRYRDGEAAIDGFLDDYAFLVERAARSV